MAIAAYHSLAHVTRALGLEFDDLPDRFLEVPRSLEHASPTLSIALARADLSAAADAQAR